MASAVMPASASCMGIALAAADHHVDPGSVRGVHATSASAASACHDRPAMWRSARATATVTAACPSSISAAGSHHCHGAIWLATAWRMNASGARCPSWACRK